MKILKIILVIIFITGIAKPTKADIIYSPYPNYGFFLSLEGIGSYEMPFSKSNTINLWGGFGGVSAIAQLNPPAFGTEIGLELRQYFSKNKFTGFNLGLYSGLAFMRYPTFYDGQVISHENSIGFVPGLKLTYKYRVNSWMIGEPYIGVSDPLYNDDLSELSDWTSYSDRGLIITIGVRIGFNKVKTN